MTAIGVKPQNGGATKGWGKLRALCGVEGQHVP